MSATFRIEGQRFMALNGGPFFKFTEAISLFIDCEQSKRSTNSGSSSPKGEGKRCGWLKDEFGLSWQTIPSVLGDLLQDNDDEKSQRVMEAMLRMDKIDI